MEILCLHSLGSCMGITNTLLPGDLKWSIFHPRPEERVMGSHSLLAGNSPSQMKNAADEVLSPRFHTYSISRFQIPMS